MPANNKKLKSLINLRDVGGVRAANGSAIKQGIIFRSANPDRISTRDINALKEMGIDVIVDLRAEYEYNKKKRRIDGIKVVSLPLDFEKETRELLYPYLYKKNSEDKILEITASLYQMIIDGSAQVFREVCELIMQPGNRAVLIHCQAGKDRTGIISALIQKLLGTPDETVIEEYLKSNIELLPYFRRKMLPRKILTLGKFPMETILFAISVKEQNIRLVLDRLDKEYKGAETFLVSAGFKPADLPKLKEKLLVNLD